MIHLNINYLRSAICCIRSEHLKSIHSRFSHKLRNALKKSQQNKVPRHIDQVKCSYWKKRESIEENINIWGVASYVYIPYQLSSERDILINNAVYKMEEMANLKPNMTGYYIKLVSIENGFGSNSAIIASHYKILNS